MAIHTQLVYEIVVFESINGHVCIPIFYSKSCIQIKCLYLKSMAL